MHSPGPGREPRPMTPDDLVDIELIKRLKYKYARCLDQKLWTEIADCFTADARAAYSGGNYSFEGRDAIVDFLSRSMGAETFHSSHKMHHPEIDLTETVKAEIAVLETDILHLWHGSRADRAYVARHEGMQQFGFDPFKDIVIEENGSWGWNTDKPDMHDYVRNYFLSRREDG